MNKLLLLVVACVLVISTVGATATVSATQVGHSPFYYFDVTNNGKAVGCVVVNTADPKTPTYVLVAHGLTPNTTYTFGYNASGEVHTLGSTYTTATGALVTSGPFPAADVKDLQSAQFWVTAVATGAGSYPQIYGFTLYVDGPFAAAIACDYSTDNGVTWHQSDRTGWIWEYLGPGRARPDLLGVPDGALVVIHVLVQNGIAKKGSEVFQYHNTPVGSEQVYATYTIKGSALVNKLTYEGILY